VQGVSQLDDGSVHLLFTRHRNPRSRHLGTPIP
jgi:hypothetical protein